jgi:hypothetical protein
MLVIGEKYESPAPRGLDPIVWPAAIDTLYRRGQRMIPWRSGRKGFWLLSDRFEEIYLDDLPRDQVLSKETGINFRSNGPQERQQNIE